MTESYHYDTTVLGAAALVGLGAAVCNVLFCLAFANWGGVGISWILIVVCTFLVRFERWQRQHRGRE